MEELLAIFCDVDDFCKAYEEYCEKQNTTACYSSSVYVLNVALSNVVNLWYIFLHFCN